MHYYLVEDGKVISETLKEGTNGVFRYFEDTEGVVSVP